MKQVPQVIVADSLLKDWPTCEIKAASSESKRTYWALCRPMSMGTVFTRARIAWRVFKGEYDALKWVQQ